jgi:phosphoribosylaminoimidazolecarboxamide formyltransferase / IMP cyclohydrolase
MQGAASDELDESLARLIKAEVSDLIIAPGYSPEALRILKSKKDGAYLVLKIDLDYEPPELESRRFYGFAFEQERNSIKVDRDFFGPPVTKNKQVTDAAYDSLIVATIALKYAQSNSVCIAYDGQLIGVGAGQQSRVHCVRLACSKVDKWLLQGHPKTLGLDFVDGLKRPEKANAVDQYLLWDELSAKEMSLLRSCLKSGVEPIGKEERDAFIARFEGIVLSSDAFFPFRDSIDRAARSHAGMEHDHPVFIGSSYAIVFAQGAASLGDAADMGLFTH